MLAAAILAFTPLSRMTRRISVPKELIHNEYTSIDRWPHNSCDNYHNRATKCSQTSCQNTQQQRIITSLHKLQLQMTAGDGFSQYSILATTRICLHDKLVSSASPATINVIVQLLGFPFSALTLLMG